MREACAWACAVPRLGTPSAPQQAALGPLHWVAWRSRAPLAMDERRDWGGWAYVWGVGGHAGWGGAEAARRRQASLQSKTPSLSWGRRRTSRRKAHHARQG